MRAAWQMGVESLPRMLAHALAMWDSLCFRAKDYSEEITLLPQAEHFTFQALNDSTMAIQQP